MIEPDPPFGFKLPHEIDEYPLEDFVRDPRSLIERLQTSGRPTKLTIDGEPQLIIQSRDGYEQLLAKLDRAEALVGIYRGREDICLGRTLPLDEAFRQIRERARVRKSFDEHVDLEAIAAIQEGLDAIARGEGRPAREARAEIRARVKGEQPGDPSTP